MSLSLSGDGTVTGVTAIGDVSSTELGYLDGVTSGLQSQINTAGGLVLVTSQSFSAVSSVSLNNCFTSSYQSYRIIFTLSAATANVYYSARMRAAGTDATGATDYTYARWDTNQAAGTGASGSTGTNLWFLGANSLSSTFSSLSLDIFNPNLAANTLIQWISFQNDNTNPYVRLGGGRHALASSYDGITFAPQSGTITGTVRVYGYRD